MLRRLANRVRRVVIGSVDHRPVVEIEGAAPHARRGPAPNRSLRRFFKAAAAFAFTLAALGAGLGAFVAVHSRAHLALDAPSAPAPAEGASAMAVAAALLTLEAELAGGGEDALFLPTERRRRAGDFQAGAAEAVAAFVEVADRGLPGRDQDLASAGQLLLSQGSSKEEAAEALKRFNARAAAAAGPAMRRDGETFAALARAALAGARAHAAALGEVARRGGVNPIDPAAVSAFERARGQAFAWRRLLLAYRDDLPAAQAGPLTGELAGAAEALGRAALYEPALLFNGPPDAVFAPNHPARLARGLREAADALQRLSARAEAMT